MAQLNVEQLVKHFPTRGEPLVVLAGLTWQMEAGESLAIVGPSGSGKTTLLHILGALDTATAGRIELSGIDVTALRGDALADFRNRQVGFVFQDHHLLPQLTAMQNVLVPALAQGTPSAATTARAEELLVRVGLADRLEFYPAELSGGQRQRVSVARALLHEPTLVLADEPTGNLDRAAAASVMELLLELHQQQQNILIVVTHSDRVAERLQRRWHLEEGRFHAPS